MVSEFVGLGRIEGGGPVLNRFWVAQCVLERGLLGCVMHLGWVLKITGFMVVWRVEGMLAQLGGKQYPKMDKCGS